MFCITISARTTEIGKLVLLHAGVSVKCLVNGVNE